MQDNDTSLIDSMIHEGIDDDGDVRRTELFLTYDLDSSTYRVEEHRNGQLQDSEDFDDLETAQSAFVYWTQLVERQCV